MIRRLEATDDLQPTVTREGVRLYGEEVVECVSRRRTLRAERDRGSLASEVFRSLDAGRSAKDIVIDERVEPRRVEELQADCARLQGGLFLSKDDLEALHRELHGGRVISPRALLAAIGTLNGELRAKDAALRAYAAREEQWQRLFATYEAFGVPRTASEGG
jgi:hypothetical protein